MPASSKPAATAEASFLVRPRAVYGSEPPQGKMQFRDAHLLRKRFTPQHLELALKMRLLPALYVRRHVERIDIAGIRLTRVIRQEVLLPTSAELHDNLLVPVALGKRNDLRDDSMASSSSGVARRLTSQEELNFSELLLVAAFERATLHGNLENQFPTEYHQQLRRLLRIPYRSSGEAPIIARDVVQWIDSKPFIADSANVESLVSTCLLLGESFIRLIEIRGAQDRDIVIERETDEPSIEVERRDLADPQAEDSRIVANLKRLFGRRDFRFSFRYSDVTDAHSFHVFVKAPAGHHVHSQSVYIGEDRSARSRATQPLESIYYRAAPLGADQAHIYFSPESAAVNTYLRKQLIEIRINIAENMPGSLIPASLSALVTLITGLILCVYAVNSPVDPRASFAAAFPAVLLSVPGLASLAFRPQDNTALANSPLVGALAAPLTATTAFALGVLYFLIKVEDVYSAVLFPMFIAVLGVYGLFTSWLFYRTIRKIRSELPKCNGLQPWKILT